MPLTIVKTTATATAIAATQTSSGYGRWRISSVTAAIWVTVFVLPRGAAGITRPCEAPTDRRIVIRSSREKITTTTHAATSPSWTRTIRTESTSSLSASGSRNFPRSLTMPLRRAICPSSVSVNEKTMKSAAASWSWPGKRTSRSAISSGIAASRLSVKRLGRFTASKEKCASAPAPTSFQADPLQEVVDVRQVHQHLAGPGPLVAPDDPMLGELVDDPASTGVADVELSLHERHRSPALSGDSPRRAREQRIQLALGGLASLPLGAGPLFEDLLHVARAALRTPEVDHRLDLGVAVECALDAGRFAGVDGLIQHVAAAEQLLRAARVEDHSAVDLGADGECDTRGDVGLDQTRDDVGRRPLGGDDEVDADRARQLRDAADELLDLAGGHHHQVGELVDHDDDVGQLASEALRGLLVVGGDVAHALGRERLVAAIHLRHRPAQRRGGLVRLDEHRQREMRQPVVIRELNALGIDEQKAQVVGRDLEEQARDQRIDAHALALAGGARDEQVRHAGQVSDDRLPGHVVAQGERKRVRALAEGRRLQHLSDRDQARRLVRHLDAHRGFARDGRLDPQRRGGERQGQVVAQRGDPLHLDTRAGL